MKKYRENYQLYELYLELREKGILQQSLGHELSPCTERIKIDYMDKMLEKNFLFIARTSKNCYWCFSCQGKITFRSQYKIIKYLDEFLWESACWTEFKKSIPLHIYYRLSYKQQDERYKEFKKTHEQQLLFEIGNKKHCGIKIY